MRAVARRSFAVCMLPSLRRQGFAPRRARPAETPPARRRGRRRLEHVPVRHCTACAPRSAATPKDAQPHRHALRSATAPPHRRARNAAFARTIAREPPLRTPVRPRATMPAPPSARRHACAPVRALPSVSCTPAPRPRAAAPALPHRYASTPRTVAIILKCAKFPEMVKIPASRGFSPRTEEHPDEAEAVTWPFSWAPINTPAFCPEIPRLAKILTISGKFRVSAYRLGSARRFATIHTPLRRVSARRFARRRAVSCIRTSFRALQRCFACRRCHVSCVSPRQTRGTSQFNAHRSNRWRPLQPASAPARPPSPERVNPMAESRSSTTAGTGTGRRGL